MLSSTGLFKTDTKIIIYKLQSLQIKNYKIVSVVLILHNRMLTVLTKLHYLSLFTVDNKCNAVVGYEYCMGTAADENDGMYGRCLMSRVARIT